FSENSSIARCFGVTSAVRQFSEKMTLASHQIEEPDRADLRQVGWTDRDIWDIAAVAGFFNMSNRMASAVDMRPNDQYHAMSR
ncbi:MAG: alkylhydroperoxidase, partial [Pseudomonadota bacterium]